MSLFRPRPFGKDFEIAEGVRCRFRRAGHILGAATVELTLGGRTLAFSGDLGPPDSATMVDPAPISRADYLVVESTYGDRAHDRRDPEDVFADLINSVAARGGTILIPSFAVGRAQTILFHLDRLKRAGRIPEIPIFLDSPMAIDASEIFCRHIDDHRLTDSQCKTSCAVADYVRDAETSKRLDQTEMPKIIISASGMATGGRILHHLKVYAPDEKSALVFAGFQAAGTRGAAIVHGAQSVKIHGGHVPIRAEVRNLNMLSAHADAGQIIDWLRKFEEPPTRTFVTHGEPAAAEAMSKRIGAELGWRTDTPTLGDRAELI